MWRWPLWKDIEIWPLVFENRPLAFVSYKPFLNNKTKSGIVFLPHFLHDIWRKTSLALNYITWSKFIHCLVAFTSWDIGQYVYCNCLLTRLWRHIFLNWPYLSNKAIFLHDIHKTFRIFLSSIYVLRLPGWTWDYEIYEWDYEIYEWCLTSSH